MKVLLQPALNDANLDSNQSNSQRQLAISFLRSLKKLSGCAKFMSNSRPQWLNEWATIETVKKRLNDLLTDFRRRLSVVVFDHRAKVLVSNQIIDNPDRIKQQINGLLPKVEPQLMKGCDWELRNWQKPKKETISQAFLLTDGENEHGDNNRCLKFAELATGCNLTLNTLGFGDHWNQDIWNKLLMPVEAPCLTFNSQIREFGRLFNRIQAVGLTNAYLLLSLMPRCGWRNSNRLPKWLQTRLSCRCNKKLMDGSQCAWET